MPIMTKTPRGDDIVILSRAEYDALTSGRRDEDAADAERANNIMADIERGTETLLTSEQASQLLEAKTPLAFCTMTPQQVRSPPLRALLPLRTTEATTSLRFGLTGVFLNTSATKGMSASMRRPTPPDTRR